MEQLKIQELIGTAMEQLKFSYVPYSHFHVGAALLAKDGTVFTGCNIENAAYGPTNCAERTAFFKAVSEGEREFTAIAIVGGTRQAGAADFCAPCGVCRQVMAEFCDPERFQIILGNERLEYKVYSLAELLPESFGKESFLPDCEEEDLQ